MTQNAHNAVIHLGHANGTVTLWTPNLPHPAVRLLAHLGPVASVSVDPSTGGRYMATAGQDGLVKVWDCRNWKGAIRTWNARGGGGEVEWSQRGALAVASGGSVNVRSRVSLADPELTPALRCTPSHPSKRPLHRQSSRRSTSLIRSLTAPSLPYASAHTTTYSRSGTTRASRASWSPARVSQTSTAPRRTRSRTSVRGGSARSRACWTRCVPLYLSS